MRRTTSTRRSAKGDENTNDKSVINPTSKSQKKATSIKSSDARVARIDKNDVVVDWKGTDDNPGKVNAPKSSKCARKTRSLKSLQQQSIPKTGPPEGDITPPRWNGKNNATKVTNKIGDVSTVHVNLQEESPSYTQTGKRIKEIYQDEFLCSQSNTDEFCDVRWECSSPDVYKHLSKKSNKVRETVSEIAHRLRVSEDDINPVESELQAKSLLGLWLPESNGGASNPSSKRLKCGGIKKKRKAVPIIPEKYQKLLEEWNARKNSEKKVLPETESAKTDCKKSSIDDPYDHLFSDEDQLLPTGVVRCTDSPPAKGADDTWSDDDLFNEDSFILAASQMPLERLAELCTGSKRKRESLGLSGKSSKDSKISPSVVTSSDSNNNNGCLSVVKAGTNSNNDVQTYNENYVKVQQTSSIPPPFKTSGNNRHSNSRNTYSAQIESSEQSAVLSRNTFYGSSKSTFRKHSSFSGSPSYEFNNSQINRNSLDKKFTNSNKSPFRKHHSFDACSSRLTSTPTRKSTFVRSIKDDDGKIIKPVRSSTVLPSTAINPKMVKPIRQLHSDNNNTINSSRSITTNGSVHVMPKINEEIKINKGGLLQTKIPLKTKESITPLENFRAENKDDLLDTSISDEILRQLAEPDEILESQSTHQETLETTKSTDVKKHEANEIIDKTLSFMFEEDDFSFSEIDGQNLDNVSICDNKELQVSKSNQMLKPTFQTRVQNSLSVAEPFHPSFSGMDSAMKKTMALTNVATSIKLNGNVPVSKNCNANSEVINSTPSQNKYSFKKRSPKQTVNGTGTRATNSKNLLESNKNKDLSNSSRFTNMKPSIYSCQPVCLNSNGSSEPLDSAVSQTQDLFVDENDSFLCEDSFLESQFLAELEKIESAL
ncbi:hypothetical protein SNE40_009203 [Patella caerulea]|uniref:Uncharacterized protein n=1 Tax=Patella caerulea TaxID=87958 RepID=A0AAN8JWL5_PATCE